MNKKIILLLFLTILTYPSKTEKTIPEKELEGWAGNPDNPNEKPFDYFYMSHKGRASQKMIDKKNGEMMRLTCIDAATIQSKGNLLNRMIGETLPSTTSPSGQLNAPSLLKELYSLDKKEEKFYFKANENFSYPINLIGVKEEENIYRRLIREYAVKIKETKVKDCKPLDIPNSEIPLSEWKECECIVYAYIQGGRDAIIKRANEIERE